MRLYTPGPSVQRQDAPRLSVRSGWAGLPGSLLDARCTRPPREHKARARGTHPHLCWLCGQQCHPGLVRGQSCPSERDRQESVWASAPEPDSRQVCVRFALWEHALSCRSRCSQRAPPHWAQHIHTPWRWRARNNWDCQRTKTDSENRLGSIGGGGVSTTGAHRHSDSHTRYSAVLNLGDLSLRESGTLGKWRRAERGCRCVG